jgi:hypothetical protein
MSKLTESQLIERATALRSKLNELNSFDQEKANQKNPAKSAEQPDTSFFSNPFANISQRNKAANNTAPQGGQGGQQAGVENPRVAAMQTYLNSKGAKLTVDGKLGNDTSRAEASMFDKIKADPAYVKINKDISAGLKDGTIKNYVKANQAGQEEKKAEPSEIRRSEEPITTNEPVAPKYSPNNPYVPKQDTSRQDAWEKLSPEDQKALGGADITDPFVLARLPNKGQPVVTPTNNQAGQKDSVAGGDGTWSTESVQESVGFSSDSLDRIVSLVHYR